ncbi:unnamed protein product [Fraxinus pennsylvanica]|uniref:Uncharacterized protein n=1 Tax=Fraxinus pennsylvanica TaxID=56036 RepID=A0AAD2A3G5_9LAMI|nr:unnamed protein product [Fraxinus pennsylvanica]
MFISDTRPPIIYFAVGTNVGDISIWEVGSRDRLALKNFKTIAFEGVAFSRHIVQIYTYNPSLEFIFYLQFIFSTAIDGKIKAWVYDSLGSRVDHDAPGLWCTTMAYSADGTRSIQNPFLVTLLCWDALM